MRNFLLNRQINTPVISRCQRKILYPLTGVYSPFIIDLLRRTYIEVALVFGFEFRELHIASVAEVSN